MQRRIAVMPLRWVVGDVPAGALSARRGLRLATPSGVLKGPDKYRTLDLKRRRAQMRARRELGLI